MSGTPVWINQPLGKERINQVAIADDGSVAVGATYFFPPSTHTGNTTKAVGVFAYDQSGDTQLLADTFSATAAPGTVGGPYSVAVSPNGKCVATCGLIDVNKGFFYVYDVPTKARYDAFANSAAPNQRVNFVAVSGKTAAGNYVVAAGSDKLYVLVGKAGGWKMSSVKTTDVVEEVAVSKDGTWIVAAIKGGSVILISNADGTGQNLTASSPYSFVVGGAATQAMSVAFSDSTGFAVAVSNLTAKSGSAVYFETAGFTPNGPLNPFSTNQLAGCTSCRWIDVSKDGKYIAAVGNVGTNQATDKGLLFLFQKSGNAYAQVFVSGPNDILQSPNSVSMDDVGLKIVVADGYVPHQAKAAFYYFSPTTKGDPTTEALTWSYVDKIMNRSAAISADGSAIIGGGNDGNMYYFKT